MATTVKSPRAYLHEWVRGLDHLDDFELRTLAVETFQDDAAMVAFALGEMARWARYKSGYQSRREARRLGEFLAAGPGGPYTTPRVQKALEEWRETLGGSEIPLGRLNSAALLARIEELQAKATGILAHVAALRDLHALLPDKTTTLGMLAERDPAARQRIGEIIANYRKENQ